MSDMTLDRSRGAERLYLRGDLQFDSTDERLYHEPLALLPALLAAQRCPNRPLRALILGGGDGLAARELLRVDAVESIRLVDIDPNVIRLGRRELSVLNHNALHNSRVRIDCQDARLALGDGQRYDIIVVDLTYPRRANEMPLWHRTFFRRLRLALSPDGIAALNAASPEHTPRAYGCIGATLEAAKLFVTPYTLELPSFRAEGYGRWGFFFATRRAIEESEWGSLELPADSVLSPERMAEARLLPESELYESTPNQRMELLAWLKTPEPVAWRAPFGRPRFRTLDRSRLPPVNAADHFGRWLHSDRGQRSIEDLIACLPGEQRGLARDALLERRFTAERALEELDLPEFLEAMRRNAARLPRQWVQELESLQTQAVDWRPSLENAALQSYRVLAIVLILLLMAHLMFPDNLYAKGYYGGNYGSGSADTEISYTDPNWRPAPFRFQTYGYRIGSVYDSNGASYPALTFLAPGAGQPPVRGFLALGPQIQLLESGLVAYTSVPPGYKAILETNRLRILTINDQPVLDLHPGSLTAAVQQQITLNQRQISQAMEDHQRWLDWTAWARSTPMGQDDFQEMEWLKKIQQLLNNAVVIWSTPINLPYAPAVRGFQVMPNVYIEAQDVPSAGRIRWVTPDGRIQERSALPSNPPTEQDRLFYILLKNYSIVKFKGLHMTAYDQLLSEWDHWMNQGNNHAS